MHALVASYSRVNLTYLECQLSRKRIEDIYAGDEE